MTGGSTKHPARGTSPPHRVDPESPGGGTCRWQRPRTLEFVSSTTTAHRRLGRFLAVLDPALVAAALAGTLALLSHSGIRPSIPDASSGGSTELDPVGVLLAACSTVPLVLWRRYAYGVFVASAAACGRRRDPAASSRSTSSISAGEW